jgi:uncharacterized lipoprotein YmbA
MSRISHRTIARLLVLVLFGIGACTLLPAQRDHSRFFLLTAASDAMPPTVSAAGLAHQVTIGLGPIGFPGYLKRPEVVTRVSSDRVELSEENRWAEPLDANFQRVLGQDLSGMLRTQRIVLFPWYGKPQIDYQVAIQVHRFETGLDKQSRLVASWSIKDGRNGADLFATETNVSSAVSEGDAGGSAAMSSDVAALSRQITEQIIKLNRERTERRGSAVIDSSISG